MFSSPPLSFPPSYPPQSVSVSIISCSKAYTLSTYNQPIFTTLSTHPHPYHPFISTFYSTIIFCLYSSTIHFIPTPPLTHSSLYNPDSHKLMQNTTCLLENLTTVRPVTAQPMISIKYDTGINADTKNINPQPYFSCSRVSSKI